MHQALPCCAEGIRPRPFSLKVLHTARASVRADMSIPSSLNNGSGGGGWRMTSGGGGSAGDNKDNPAATSSAWLAPLS